MAANDSRPVIAFAAETFPPRFLAAGFGVSVTWPTSAAAAVGAGELVSALTGGLAGVWHVEYEDYHGYVMGKVPVNPGWGGTAILLGFTPIFEDPSDEDARGLHGEALAGLLSAFGSFPEAILLPDWAITPTRRTLALVRPWFDPSDPAAFADRADRYVALRAARARWLSPWLDGARPVRTLAAFRELHGEMPPDEACLAAIIWGRGSIYERKPATGRLGAAIDGLIARGWIERTKSTYSKDIIVGKTRRFAHRLPVVEALAY